MARPAEVFLSHAHQDQPAAEALAAVFARHRVPVWFAPAKIRGAQQWHDEIGRALARCDWFVLLLSPRSVRSRWVKRELLYALDHDRYDDRVLPVVIEDCDPAKLSWVLDQRQRITMLDGHDRGYASLLRTWGIRYRRGAAPPSVRKTPGRTSRR